MLAMPVVPEGLRRRLANSGAHHAATGRCLVCDLIDAERRDGRRIVLEDEHFVSMVPFGSGMPFEVRLAPRRHESSFLDLDATRTRALAGHLREALSKLANALQDPPYNWFLHTSPVRPTDGTFHWHIELMPRLSQFAAYELATEGWINPVPPEEGAAELRRA
jgi:UDPglucose--hexose-1-phosphate uridylyltransferase